MAVYLDPVNIPPKTSLGSENMTNVPNRRPIEESLIMGDQITRRASPVPPAKDKMVWGKVAKFLGMGDEDANSG